MTYRWSLNAPPKPSTNPMVHSNTAHMALKMRFQYIVFHRNKLNPDNTHPRHHHNCSKKICPGDLQTQLKMSTDSKPDKPIPLLHYFPKQYKYAHHDRPLPQSPPQKRHWLIRSKTPIKLSDPLIKCII